MSLQIELDELYKKFTQKVPPDVLNTMLGVTRRLVESGIAKNSLKVGDKAPDFNLPNATGEEVRLKELLDKGPVVLNFYRGGCCPYCNLELNAYQKHLQEINELGASFVAISPQTPDKSLSTAEKNELKFQVLSDVGNKVADQFGLVFKLPTELQELYNNFGISLPKFNGDDVLWLNFSMKVYLSDHKPCMICARSFNLSSPDSAISPPVGADLLREFIPEN